MGSLAEASSKVFVAGDDFHVPLAFSSRHGWSFPAGRERNQIGTMFRKSLPHADARPSVEIGLSVY